MLKKWCKEDIQISIVLLLVAIKGFSKKFYFYSFWSREGDVFKLSIFSFLMFNIYFCFFFFFFNIWYFFLFLFPKCLVFLWMSCWWCRRVYHLRNANLFYFFSYCLKISELSYLMVYINLFFIYRWCNLRFILLSDLKLKKYFCL